MVAVSATPRGSPDGDNPKGAPMRYRPHWQDLLTEMFSGFFLTDQSLETLLDHLERLP